jgi:small subunit ribosomal protein S6
MSVKKEAVMREYELTYLIGAGYTAAEMNSIQDEVVTLVGKSEGEIVETQDWGKKVLAYAIKKDGKTYTEAVYIHLVLKLPTELAQSFGRSVELKRQILRSLLVVK